jgi:hypothetical protein
LTPEPRVLPPPLPPAFLLPSDLPLLSDVARAFFRLFSFSRFLFRRNDFSLSSESLCDEPDFSEDIYTCSFSEPAFLPRFIVLFVNSTLCLPERKPSKKPPHAPMVNVSFSESVDCAAQPDVMHR